MKNQNKKGRPNEGSPKQNTPDNYTFNHPIVTGQAAEVIEYLRKHGPTESFTFTAELAVPEVAARIHELKRAGWNINTVILDEYRFRGRIRRRVARYSLGVPEWIPLHVGGEARGGLI
ncbi:MAG: hypothetical protein JNM61_08770 [Zoogloeaceae bacterium]|nr:hypothetical protein [Zoogloeaceae bacterium]